MEGASARVVAVDASVLINLIHGNQLPLLGALRGFAFVVPQQAVEEITHPEQAALLTQALDQGHLRRESRTDPAELAAYAELRKVVGKGEAACLAMAQTRGWLVACDERGRFLREVRDRLGAGRVLNTPGLILLAIRRGIMTVAEADSLKALLETRRFKMRFGSFGDLLTQG